MTDQQSLKQNFGPCLLYIKKALVLPQRALCAIILWQVAHIFATHVWFRLMSVNGRGGSISRKFRQRHAARSVVSGSEPKNSQSDQHMEPSHWHKLWCNKTHFKVGGEKWLQCGVSLSLMKQTASCAKIRLLWQSWERQSVEHSLG